MMSVETKPAAAFASADHASIFVSFERGNAERIAVKKMFPIRRHKRQLRLWMKKKNFTGK
jgi:hypothetical protein